MHREIRYQGAIIRDDHILLIRHNEHATGDAYWLLPGGGILEGETPAECVRREMKEETGLDVQVQGQLLDWPSLPGDIYWRLHTYLCAPAPGEPAPGYETEAEAIAHYAIDAVKWFDLRDDTQWDASIHMDPYTQPQLQQIRTHLGYVAG